VVAGGVEIDVLVSPKSGKSEVEGFDEWRNRLVVKLKAPPEKGEANRELVFLLGAALVIVGLVITFKSGNEDNPNAVPVAKETRHAEEGAELAAA